MARERKGTSLSGWCLPNQPIGAHEQCRSDRCTCECHTTEAPW